MTLQILKKPEPAQKPKKSVVVTNKAEQFPYAETVDAILKADAELKAMNAAPLLKIIDAGKKELQSIAKDEPKDQPVAFLGTLGVVELTACSKSTVLKEPEKLLQHLIDKFGTEAMLKCVTVVMGEVRNLLSENELKPFIEEGYGSRTAKLKHAE